MAIQTGSRFSHPKITIFPTAILETFARFAERVAFVHRGVTITYADALGQLYRLARALKSHGLGSGDGVLLLPGSSPDLFLTRLAAQLLGCRVIGIDPAYSAPEREHILTDSRAVALIQEPAARDTPTVTMLEQVNPSTVLSLDPATVGVDLLELALRQPPDPVQPSAGSSDIARLVYTGGSTGRSKGCCHTFGAMTAHWAWQPARWSAEVAAFAAAAQRFLLTSSAGASVGGDYMALALLRGGTVYLHDRFDADAMLQTVQQEKITATFVGTAKLCHLLDYPALERTDTSSLRAITFAGSAITTRQFQQAIDRFGPILHQAYGQSEAGLISVLAPEDLAGHPERLLSAGRPQPGVDLSIRHPDGRETDSGETGEIWIRTPQQMTGYWRRPDLSAQTLRHGWINTGDLGYRDTGSYLYLVDRAKDMVIVRGENCFSRIIEEILTSHPAIHQAAVIGVPHESDGEAVHAVVVAKASIAVSPTELQDLVAGELSPLHAPKSISFVKRLPLTSAGKVDKKALRAPFWAGRERPIN